MTQRFYQGRTNNHLTWVMVDATDFATPESALSAAIKIKIYGKLQGATGVNFVSSGTGSLTNDITHVGASALGIYTIALAKADLSDASAAWYDQYVVSLSATGAAYQAMIVEGVLAGGIVSNISGAISDTQSYLAVMSGILSDAYSAIVVTQSAASDAASAAAQGNSRVLLVQSRLSDLDSRLVSDVSDIYSMVTALSGMISDVDSALASDYSDLKSAIGAITVTLTASDISDIASATAAAVGFTASGIAAKVWSDYQSKVGASPSQVYSALLVGASAASDIHSMLSANRSEPGQGAPAAATTALAKLDYLYKAWRNRTKQTQTKYLLYADDETTVDQSAAFSATTASAVRVEIGTGA